MNPDNPPKLIDWRGLSEHFKAFRGEGIGYHTLQAWQTMGMPHIRQGRRVWYEWQDCLDWWKMTFAVIRRAG